LGWVHSRLQVRRPLYGTSVGRWRRYAGEAEVGAVMEELAGLGVEGGRGEGEGRRAAETEPEEAAEELEERGGRPDGPVPPRPERKRKAKARAKRKGRGQPPQKQKPAV
jgi:hypothetical protein